MNPAYQRLRTRIRWATACFILGLGISGVTAIPLQTEVEWLARVLGVGGATGEGLGDGMGAWLGRVQSGLQETNTRYPFITYGGDWLAFGHFVIALAFLWAWRDPLRNRWLFDYGLVACALVIPYALVFGALRGIPWWWRLIDCSFGVCGALPLWLCRRWAQALSEAIPSEPRC